MQQQLINFMINKISVVSGIPIEDIDAREPLLDLGLSSFMMAEASAAIEDEFDIKMSPLEMANGASIKDLAKTSVEAIDSNLVAIEA